MAEVAELKTFLGSAEDEGKRLDKALEDALAVIPNVPFDDVPVGPDEHANVEKSRWGTRPTLNDAKEHYELGEALGMMDFETAAKLSGSRFVVLKKGLARMERALGQFMLDLHTTEHGYEEIQPPLLVRDEVMFGTGQLPKFGGGSCSSTSRATIRRDARSSLSGLRFASRWQMDKRRRVIGRRRSDRSRQLCRATLERGVREGGSSLAHPHRRSPADQSRPRVRSSRKKPCRSASRR